MRIDKWRRKFSRSASDTGKKSRRFRRGVYLLPSMFTVGNILCGYLAILHAMKGDFWKSALLILLATVLDFLDGKVARLTHSTSPFGLEFDSLADLISFGIAPAILVQSWGLAELNRLGGMASFLFVICSATRLARFNIQSAHVDKKYFVGLPIPAAAAVLAANVFFHPDALQDRFTSLLFCAFLILISVLMVSKFRYRSFKEIDIRNRKPYIFIVGFALLVAAVVTAPKEVLLVVCYGYLLSGLLPRSIPAALFRRLRREKSAQVKRESGND